MSKVLAAYSQARPLLWMGLAGLALSGFCAARIVLLGQFIPPEGDLTKPMSFDAAVGFYLLTIALFVPLAGFSERGRRTWLRFTVGFTLYSFTIETVQPFRGLDPRFSRHFTPLEQIAGITFGVVALNLIVLYAILARKLFARGTGGGKGLMLLSIRYASGAVALAFAAGISMSVLLGRTTPSGGNLLPLHAAGFHALQAIPLIALLLQRSNIPPARARRFIHIAGIAWIGMCLAIAWQTVAGRSVIEISVPMILAGIQMAVWIACALLAFLLWRRGPAVQQAL